MNEVMKFYSKMGSNLILRAIPGHFATSHSHINYYVDMTGLKTRCSEAKAVAKALVRNIPMYVAIDTIICLDGTEVIGAFMGDELEEGEYRNTNKHQTVYVVTPEFNSVNQMIFRDNLIPSVRDKNCVLLVGTSTTGVTISRSIECVEYYGGNVGRIFSVFSAVDKVGDKDVISVFKTEDVPGYAAYDAYECPFCRNAEKIDALVNGNGFSAL